MTIDIYKQAFYSPSSFFSSFFAPTEIYVVAKEDIEKAKHEQYHAQLKAINERIDYLNTQTVSYTHLTLPTMRTV